nr:hypothetical protein [Tanacetum cinerariifolium]
MKNSRNIMMDSLIRMAVDMGGRELEVKNYELRIENLRSMPKYERFLSRPMASKPSRSPMELDCPLLTGGVAGSVKLNTPRIAAAPAAIRKVACKLLVCSQLSQPMLGSLAKNLNTSGIFYTYLVEKGVSKAVIEGQRNADGNGGQEEN